MTKILPERSTPPPPAGFWPRSTRNHQNSWPEGADQRKKDLSHAGKQLKTLQVFTLNRPQTRILWRPQTCASLFSAPPALSLQGDGHIGSQTIEHGSNIKNRSLNVPHSVDWHAEKTRGYLNMCFKGGRSKVKAGFYWANLKKTAEIFKNPLNLGQSFLQMLTFSSKTSHYMLQPIRIKTLN